MKNYYTVYDLRDETVIAFGNSQACAKALNIKLETFYYYISRQKRNPNAKRHYYIVKDDSEQST